MAKARSDTAVSLLAITRTYRQNAGGMERLSWELIRELQKQTSLQVTVLAHQGSRQTSPLFVLACIPKALAYAHRADVIHIGDPMLAGVGWLLKKLYRKPVAVTVHGLDITYTHPLYRLYLKLFFDRLDIYLPISRYVNKLLEKRGITNSRRKVINPGTTDRYYDPSITREKLIQLLNNHDHLSTPKDKILFTVGRLVERKGHAWFVTHVMPKLPLNTKYVIAGEGPEQENITREARAANCEDRVIMLGRVTDAELKVLYNTVDAFIQSNIHVENDVEGFGLVLLEAALCNRPVLASNIDGIPDAIQDGKNGTLLSSEDVAAWSSALTQTPRFAMDVRSFTLEQYNWKEMVSDYHRALASAEAGS